MPVEQFKNLEARTLYCPRCRTAQPVRDRLLLVLPDYDLHEYRCQVCFSSVGTRKVSQRPQPRVLLR
jgi:hypothetical protein